MKHLITALLVSLTSFHVIADTSMEVFCTKFQCEKMGLKIVPSNTVVYVVDAHLRTADKINSTYMRGVKTLAQAEAIIPELEKTTLYQQMISQMKSAGEGLQKVIRDYDLKKLPAFVCHREALGTGVKEQAVIYGGNFKRAENTCSLWVARGRHE